MFRSDGEQVHGGYRGIAAEQTASHLRKIGTVHKGTSPYHPRTNGKVERLNGILEDMISKLLFGKPTKL